MFLEMSILVVKVAWAADQESSPADQHTKIREFIFFLFICICICVFIYYNSMWAANLKNSLVVSPDMRNCICILFYLDDRDSESVWQHIFWALKQDISDSEISCKNGYNACERRCFSCEPVSGLLPDAGWQVIVLLLLPEDWDQLLLLLGHQGGGSFVFCKEEEEETNSINLETQCQEKRTVFAEKTCFTCTSFKPSF